ncbi:hypothetical protein D9611_005514 [Ephemerocybe angulata]|uniref:WD40 repeat-like protein n=1 Tax=Ephemerocybe angulata TaxID=980116 RepID=A0A8H5BHS4_9AGAR|nr:hypothetical protein D9611_005514 [Tulosesus angulatus]
MTVTSPLRISAEELNCLIYSYFQDSGLKHSAFTILHEGKIHDSPYLVRHIPRGELIDLLGKALLYLEVEAHWNPDAVTRNCKAGFSLLEKHVCSSESSVTRPPVNAPPTVAPTPSSIPQPQASTSIQPESSQPPPHTPQKSPIASTSRPVAPATQPLQPPPSASLTVTEPGSGTKRKSSPIEADVPVEKRQKTSGTQPGPSDMQINTHGMQNLEIVVKKGNNRHRLQGPGDKTTDPRAIRLLPGHNTEIFVCAWNPEYPGILSTGGKDSEVILWDLAKKATSPNEFVTDGSKLASLGRLSHAVQGDLTSLHWSADGTFLAVGSYDSVLRVATNKGTMWMQNDMHDGPIFATRFSKSGHLLLTASLDGTSCVWDVDQKRPYRQYKGVHTDCCLDVDWITDKIFASTGADKRVIIMHIDQDEPLKILEGHTEEVNQIRTNSTGTRLASCSDDGTSRIWKTDNQSLSTDADAIPGLSASKAVLVLEGHSEPVSAIGWCPTSNTSKGHEILATGSFDKTARLWDSVTGECLAIFTDHKRPVYTLTFSPDGRFVATGGGDGWLYVYSLSTFKVVWSWFAGAQRPGIFEIDWQMKNGYNRIALALEGQKVMVVDCTKVPVLQTLPTNVGI